MLPTSNLVTMYQTTPDEAARLIATAMDQQPRLTHFGMGVFDEPVRRRAEGKSVVETELASQRAELRKAVGEVQRAADWIKRQNPIGSFNERHTSYGYKHEVERWWRERGAPGGDAYVSNGAFIAAAIGLGWEVKTDDGPNAWFKFSEKTVRDITTAPRA